MPSFAEQGFIEVDALHHHPGIKILYDAINATRRFDESLFMTEDEWENSSKSHAHTNPRLGNNALESFKDELAFLEQNPTVKSAAAKLLGENFRWAFSKVVCRLPRSVLPKWVDNIVGDLPANTLNAFMHPQYRDISYYLESDLHQDIQDYPRLPADRRDHRMLVMYVHLTDVGPEDAPLYILPGSHKLGVTPYQHDITQTDSLTWKYHRPECEVITAPLYPVLAPAGHIVMWHSCLIHGTKPIQTGKHRLVLRYMLTKSSSDKMCELEKINNTIHWPLYPQEDFSAGAKAQGDGKWTLKNNDFTRWNP